VKKALGPLLAALVLAGCTVGPDYRRPEMAVPQSHRGVAGAASPESLADLSWWQLFKDPALQSLVTEALRNNRDLALAAARVTESRALYGASRGDLWPQAGYGANAQREKAQVTGVGTTYNSFGLSGSITWEIDLWGRIRRGNETALAQLLASEDSRRGVVLSLVTDVATAYLELRELDRELEIVQRTIATRRSTLDLFGKRLLGGVSNKLETSQAEASLAQSEAALPNVKLGIVQKENQLGLLLGRPPGLIARGQVTLDPAQDVQVPAGLPSALLERRPDVRKAEQLLHAACAQVGVAEANFFPQLSLTGGAGFGSTELSNVLKSGSFLWDLGASLTGPIFQGGKIKRNYEAALARLDQARATYEQAVLTALGEVSNSLESHVRLAEVSAAQERNVVALREAERLALLRYDGGVSNYLDVLDAQRQLFSGEVSLAQGIRDRLRSVIQLYRALGGGWNSPEMMPIAPAAAAPAAAASATGPKPN
jgi:outer membrane protein, multidrug efflux system